MKKARIVALALALALLPGTALAGGRGDNYARPISIDAVSYTSVHHNSKGATTQSGEPSPVCQGSFSRTYWYVFTPGTTAYYIADTLGSDFDTILAIYTYDGATFTSVACDDDAGNSHGGSNNESWLDVQLTSGTTYYFQVGSFSSNYGYLEFNLGLD